MIHWRKTLTHAGTLALALALLATLQPSCAHLLNWDRVPLGYVLSKDEVVANFGSGAVRTGVANESRSYLRLPPLEATTRRRSDPAWLFFSNSPEFLNPTSLPGRRGLLAAAEVPVGSGRVLVSHGNYHPMAMDYVLRMTNAGDTPAEVVLDPRVSSRENLIPATYRVDAAVGGFLAETYLKAVKVPPPLGWRPADGERKRILRQRESSDAVLVRDVRGLGTALASLTTTAPIRLSLYAVPSGGRIGEDAPVLPRTGSQVRGLFQAPDMDVDATIDVSDGNPRRLVFGEAERNNNLGVLDAGNWMAGEDTTTGKTAEKVTNRGDFGGITWLKVAVKGGADGPYVGAMFVLVAGGRKSAVIGPKNGKAVVLPQWNGLVVGRAKVGETWEYAFTLPPNSWAPVYLVAVPLHAP